MSDSLDDGARATSNLDSRSRERNNHGALRALLKSAEHKGVRVLQVAVAATAHLIVARDRLAFVIPPDGVAALWPPAEIALATLRLSG